MTQKTPTANGGVQTTQTAAQIRILPHAEERWGERTPAQESLRAAWAGSVRVQVPGVDADETRLYAPYDALLVYRQGALRTVLNKKGWVGCPSLGECTACGNVIDPVVDEVCRWCGTETETQGHGRASLSRGDLA